MVKDIAAFAESMTKLAAELTQMAHIHPNWKVERNNLRNVVIVAVDGTHMGYVDMGNDSIESFDDI